ncbi:hypothetical protein MYX06_02715 [Patescibacteria group bacterium AH-259-L05]|nr:hypothetical protein [Patescibacteria group bacterium AH-259-L05]
MTQLSIGVIIVVLFALWLQSKFYSGYYRDGSGQLRQALFGLFPGYNTLHYSEQIVELKDWAGTRHDSFSIRNKDGKENPEATAGLGLKIAGIFSADYELKQKEDGHWILYKPERTHRYFDWNAHHRITKGKRVEK